MRWFARAKPEQNRAAVDPWTIVHFAAGLAAGLVGTRLRWAMAAAAGYEVVEQAFERTETGRELFRTSGPEVAANAAVDLVVFAAGHALGRWWNGTGRGRRGGSA
ncbi:MAG TPA: hypothetical protein VHM02_12525 [Thermoanaerobaculia bacterium]|nr:hypothetical protein [Thermoanaerobaculia bacterium]